MENNKQDYSDTCSDSATVMTTIKEVTFMSDLILINSFGQFIHKVVFVWLPMFAKRVALEERTEYTSVITTEELCKKYVGNKGNRKPFIHESHE